MKRLYIIIFLFLLSTSCNNNKVKLSKEELTRYNTTIQQLDKIETLYNNAVNDKSLADLMEISQSISYEYNDEGMNQATIQHCDSLKNRIAELKMNCKELYEQVTITSGKIDLININNEFTEGTATYPVYLNQGELLFYKIKMETASTIKIYNYDARRIVKHYSNRQNVNDSLRINYSGIYLIEFIPTGSSISL